MAVEPPFIIRNFTVSPSGEWSPRCNGWTAVRIAEGFGYCLYHKTACGLQPGDGFMSPQTTCVTVRASQLVALRLQCFQIQPELLNGLLTVDECHQLKTLSTSPACISFFKADEPVGREFSRLSKRPHSEILATRCELLQLWADGISGLFRSPAQNDSGAKNLRGRFRQLLEQLPEAGLLEFSLAELARQIQCSERHLGRLFHQEFGAAFRSHQIELRLQRACRLLADPRIKIASIACESGFQHLGLFNATFKRRFGMTPGEWRRQNPPDN